MSCNFAPLGEGDLEVFDALLYYDFGRRKIGAIFEDWRTINRTGATTFERVRGGALLLPMGASV